MECVVGIDLGGTNVKGGVVAADGTIIVSRAIKTHASRGPEKVVTAMAAFVRELIDASGRTVTRGGIGAPGPLSQAQGMIFDSPNLKGWNNFPIVRRLAEESGISFVLENDANAACLGEKLFGAGKPFDPIVHLTLGTGTGGGVYLNGRLFTGPSGAGAELGHMTIDMHGLPCGCGAAGHLETFASDTGIRTFLAGALEKYPDSLLNNQGPENINFKTVKECADKADVLARLTYERFVYGLGVGIANLVNIFNPQAVILSGGIARQAPAFLPEVERIVKAQAFPVLTAELRIMVSTLGDDTGVLGAAACAIMN